MGQMSFLPPNH